MLLFGGHIAGMVISLRNNLKLRKRASVFDKDKSFSETTTTHDALHKTLEIKHLSEGEKAYFRNKTITENKKENRIRWIIVAFMAMFVIAGSYFIVEAVGSKQARRAELQLQSDRQNHDLYVRRSLNFAVDKKWPEAIYELKQALLLFPDNYDTKMLLANTYTSACADGSYCSKGIKYLTYLIAEYPGNHKLYEMRSAMYFSLGETDNALEDLEMAHKD